MMDGYEDSGKVSEGLGTTAVGKIEEELCDSQNKSENKDVSVFTFIFLYFIKKKIKRFNWMLLLLYFSVH